MLQVQSCRQHVTYVIQGMATVNVSTQKWMSVICAGEEQVRLWHALGKMGLSAPSLSSLRDDTYYDSACEDVLHVCRFPMLTLRRDGSGNAQALRREPASVLA